MPGTSHQFIRGPQRDKGLHSHRWTIQSSQLTSRACVWSAAELPRGSRRKQERSCDLARSRRIAGDTVAYIGRERLAVGRAALRRALSRLFWFARRRAEARVPHRETRLLTQHTPAHRHAQRASYKNIRVSPSLADGCYHGDAVTNRERVRARERAYITERGNLAEFNQSRRQ